MTVLRLADYDVNGTVGGEFPSASEPDVYSRAAWEDDWALVHDLWAESVTWSCGPAIPTAQLRFVYGRMRTISVGRLAKFFSIAKQQFALPRYVKISVYSDRAASGSRNYNYWHGLMEVSADQIDGIADFLTHNGPGGSRTLEKVMTGQQVIMCYGLEQLLHRHQIRSTYFDRGAGAERCEARVAFNDHGKPNRGNADYDGAKVFYYRPNDKTNCSFWSTQDIVQYLLRYQTPVDAAGDRKIIFECPDLAKLPDWDAPFLETDGATTLSLIQRLVSRQRLLTHWWEVRANGSGVETVRLRVETLTAAAVVLSARAGAEVPAASRLLDVIHDMDNATSVVVKDSELQVYDVVYAHGAPELSVGTFAVRDGTLAAGWTAAQQSAYYYGASQLPAYATVGLAERQKMNTAARSDPQLDEVYSKFTIAPDWDQKVGNGVGGPTSIMFPGSAGALPVYYATMFIEHGLPLYAGVDYSGDRINLGTAAAAEPRDDVERRHVLAVFQKPTADQDGTQRWFRAEDMAQLGKLEGIDAEDSDRISVHVSVPSRSHAIYFRVSGAPQHAIAKTLFVPLAEDDKPPEWDVSTGCLVTLALPSGRRVMGRFPPVDPVGRDTIRTLEIDAGGRYERVFVAQQTVVGVDAGGNLVRSNGGWIERPANVVAILNDLAQVAAGWYTVPHRVVEIQTSRILHSSQIGLGDFVRSIGDNSIPNNLHYEVVNASVSEIRLSWPTAEGEGPPPMPMMTIHTFAGELDPLAFGPSALNPAALPFGVAAPRQPNAPGVPYANP